MNRPLRTRSSRARVAMLLALALSIPAALPLGTASASHFAATEELTATDNIGAAIAYSASTFETAEEVALGRNDAFPDSLASGMLQATRPLLLTAADQLSEATKEELARLAATTVHVLGGEQAIQPAVVTALEAEGYTVQRHAGPTRVDTAVAVAKNLGAAATSAIVARAFGTAEDETRAFADSLAAGGWAAAAAMPVLLTETEKLSDAVATYLEESSITEVFVVGGQAAVSEAVVTQLTAQGMTVKRVSGPTRFHTALAIAAERGFATAADAEKVILTEGQAEDAWAAGFAAAGRSAKDNAPIVLAVGAEVPEPTLQFLTGTGGEPTPDPEPTEDPTGEPTPDPTEEPTTDPTEEPTTDPTEEPTGDPTEEPTGDPTPEPDPDAGAGTGLAALLCAPMLASEACDIAAEALGQGPGEGPGLLHVEVPAVSRFDHAEGRVTIERKAVNAMSVTGCGYTSEPVYVENDGRFYLLLAGDPGTCSAEFALDTPEGVQKQTVEFNVGEDFVPSSSMPIPELVVVRPVKQDEEGVHLRFVFDEPIAPSPAIDFSKFHVFDYEGTPELTATATESLPSSVRQDPRYPRAVLAVFSAKQYEESTVAVVRGGLVCGDATLNDNGSKPCRIDSQTVHPQGHKIPGAVRDIDSYPNPTAHFGLRSVDRTTANSGEPDLISVDGFQAGDSSLVFTFTEAVAVPTAAGVGAATALLRDGTIKKSNADGWSRGPDDHSLRVSFSADGLTAADMEEIRRGMVDKDTVALLAEPDNADKKNTPVAVVIAGGGISDLPDFVGVEGVDVTVAGQKVTYVFEEPLDEVNATLGRASKFVAVMSDGSVVVPPTYTNATCTTNCTRNLPKLEDDKKKVTVSFARKNCGNGAPADCEAGGGLDNGSILYHTVLTGAVRSFASQQWNFADSIRISTPVIYGPGITLAPDLREVQVQFKAGEMNNTIGALGCTNDRLTISIKFDQPFSKRANVNDFRVWYMGGTDNDQPRVYSLETTTDTTNEARREYGGGNCDAQATGPKESGAPGVFGVKGNGSHIRFISVELDHVTADAGMKWNYPAGLVVPN